MSELDTKVSECKNGKCTTETLLVIYTCTGDTLAWVSSLLVTSIMIYHILFTYYNHTLLPQLFEIKI